MPEARLFEPGDLRSGLQAEFEREITAADVTAFAELSGDWNPLHTNEAYAQGTNYGRRIVHGAFQVGLASTMAGMHLPGREVVVGSFQCRFPAPLFYPSRVRVQGEIITWSPETISGTLRVRVFDISAGILTAEIHVGLSLHELRKPLERRSTAAAVSQEGGDKPLVLITGASGGLGRSICELLSSSMHVIGLSRSLPEDCVGRQWIAADLSSPDWESTVAHQLNGRRLHGIVHAAWPACPQGGLLEAELEAVRAQLEVGGAGTIRLARFLHTHVTHAKEGGRLVILGTTAATIKPVLNMAAYSLGKAALEHTVRLLAPELARAGITINIIAPSFIATGMNSAKTSRVILTETAKVPLGRLCTPEDVARSVSFLLSPDAAFVTGQILPLTGGQL